MTMRYGNAGNTVVLVDGVTSIPVDLANREWRKVLQSGQPIDPYVPPATEPNVRVLREDAVRALLVERSRGANVPSAITDYLSADP